MVALRLPRETGSRRERLLVGLFCLLAGLRVLVYAAAFPFFNNVDEYDHFDVVCKYAQGHVPRGLEQWSEEAAAYVALYGSPEFLGVLRISHRERLPRQCGPLAKGGRQRLRADQGPVEPGKNYESVQPPFTMWSWVLGSTWENAGLRGGNLLYWTRIANVLAYVCWSGSPISLPKSCSPDSKFLYLGVPAVLVSMPQDIFCGLNNDVLSAPLVTLSLYLLVRLYRSEPPSGELAVDAGLSTAAAFSDEVYQRPAVGRARHRGVVQTLVLVARKQPQSQLVPVVLLLRPRASPSAVGWDEITGFG